MTVGDDQPVTRGELRTALRLMIDFHNATIALMNARTGDASAWEAAEAVYWNVARAIEARYSLEDIQL